VEKISLVWALATEASRVGEPPGLGSSGIHLSIDGKIATAAPGEPLLEAVLTEKPATIVQPRLL
jgi:hypothetical protein